MNSLGSSNLSTVEKRIEQLAAQIHQNGLNRIISKRTFRSLIGEQFASESTIDQHEAAITDRLGLIEHPANPQLYIPKEKWSRSAAGAPKTNRLFRWIYLRRRFRQQTTGRTLPHSPC
jgi:hypothetical protein